MALFKNTFVVGIAAGLTATVLAPVLVPALREGLRPLAKLAVRGALGLYEHAREAVAHAGEAFEDVVAEVRSERGHPEQAPFAPAPTPDQAAGPDAAPVAAAASAMAGAARPDGGAAP